MERTGGWLGLRLGLESGCSAVKGTLALLCLQDKALASRTGALSVPAAVTSTQCGSNWVPAEPGVSAISALGS